MLANRDKTVKQTGLKDETFPIISGFLTSHYNSIAFYKIYV